MIKKRINTDIFITISIVMQDGSPTDLSAATDLSVVIFHAQYSNIRFEQNFSRDGNVLSLQFSSGENTKLGTFNITVKWRKRDLASETGYRNYALDFRNAFQIVNFSDEESALDVEYKGVGTVSQCRDGIDGASALDLYRIYTGNSEADLKDMFDFLSKPAVDAAETVRIALANLTEMEQLIKANEEQRIKSEQLRDKSESERQSKDNERQTAETGRTRNETIRIQEEQKRKDSEKDRVLAEQNRSQAFYAAMLVVNKAVENADAATKAASDAAADGLKAIKEMGEALESISFSYADGKIYLSKTF